VQTASNLCRLLHIDRSTPATRAGNVVVLWVALVRLGASTGRGAGMAESEQSQRKSRRADDREVEELAPADTAHKAELDSEVDSLLDEIDDVLEVNAEEFVRSFVQKGGQ
jgi:prokaryotic ubiquitin-like protein Pup